MAVKVLAVRDKSVDLISYTIPYIISFFGIDLGKPADVISLSIFLLIMLLLTITSKSVFLNPILAMFGYGLFEVEYQYDQKQFSTVSLSKVEIEKGKIYYIRSLTKFLYLITEKKTKNDT